MKKIKLCIFDIKAVRDLASYASCNGKVAIFLTNEGCKMVVETPKEAISIGEIPDSILLEDIHPTGEWGKWEK